MTEPMLTSLCSICHVSEPKYKCPRCDVRTCSLACIKKHKAWAGCSGERDATAYKPPSKLRTPAGVDHDYNFLHGIEMSLERTEKILVDEKALIQKEELRPLTMQEVRWKTGRDGKKRKVIVTRLLREAKGRVFERFLLQKLKKYNVDVICSPMGMSRQKENKTTLNRRTGRINWQVEWFQIESKGTEKPKRCLSKTMDDIPIYLAHRSMVDEESKLQAKLLVSKASKPDQQKPPHTHSTSTSFYSRWPPAPACMQDPLTNKWILHDGRGVDMWPDEMKQEYTFYLGQTLPRSDQPTPLVQLDPNDCLRDILSNTKVIEFPSIYVLRAEQILPADFVLGNKVTTVQQTTTKRKESGTNSNATHIAKRRKRGLGGDGDNDHNSNDSGGDDDEGGHKGSGEGLEAGEVVAEQSFGEEEEDDDDEDDDTSSSGSDSEEDEQ